MHSLLSVGSCSAWLTLPGQVELLTIGALRATLLPGHGVLDPGGHSNTTHVAGELARIWLELPDTTWKAEAGDLIVVVARGALLLTVRHLCAAFSLGHPNSALYFWTGIAGLLSLFS